MKSRTFFVTASALCALAAVGAQAREIRLTIAAGQIPRAIPALNAVPEFFVPEVEKRVKAAKLPDTIVFRQAWAGTLLKPRGVLLGTQDGIADIGFVPGVFHPDKLPLEQMSFATPFCTVDTLKVTAAANVLHEKIPEVKAQFDKFNVIRLAGSSGDSFQFFTNFPVDSIKDLNGRKLAATGALLQWYKGLGVTAVDSNMMDYYNSTKTGVYNGFIIMGSAAVPMKYPEAAPYVTQTNFGATYTNLLVMNKNSYAKLPKEIQKIIGDVAKEWAVVADKATAAAGARGLEGAKKAFPNATIKVMSAEERKRWATAMPNVAKEWAGNLDKQGLPGTKLLGEYMNALRAQGVQCMRDWDKQ